MQGIRQIVPWFIENASGDAYGVGMMSRTTRNGSALENCSDDACKTSS
jgi:hypothetical protein